MGIQTSDKTQAELANLRQGKDRDGVPVDSKAPLLQPELNEEPEPRDPRRSVYTNDPRSDDAKKSQVGVV